jgi:hypothetical protein
MASLSQIDTSTLSNQNLSSALLVHTFTNTERVRKVFVEVDLDQIAGNGDYTVHATIQRAGAGSAFRVTPVSTGAVASGVTSASFVSIPIVLNATDVLKVYVTGLAGDTTTPDVITRVWEEGVDVVVIESGISASAALTNDSGTQLTTITMPQAIAALLSSAVGQVSGVESLAPIAKQTAKPAGNTRISSAITTDGRTITAIKVPD